MPLLMKDSLIKERLRNVDKELHLIMDELETKKSKVSPKDIKEPLSLSQLNKLMERDRISDEDSTELIRRMRDREYDL